MLYYLFVKNNPDFEDDIKKAKKTFQRDLWDGLKEVFNINEDVSRKGWTWSTKTTKNTYQSTDSLFSFWTPMNSLTSFLWLVWKIILWVLVLLVITSWFKVVSPGERGVKVTLWKVSPVELNEWLHWKIPLIQTIKPMSIQVQKLETISSSASKDLQSVQTDMALNYNLKPWNIVGMYQNIWDEKIIATKIIDPAIQESVKAATAQFTAEELISKRPEVNKVMHDLLVSKLDSLGVKVVAVNIVNFQFSDAFDLAIEAKVKAEQEALTEKNKLEQIKFQAQQRVETAKWDAESILVKAKAEAEGNKIVSESLTEQLVKYRGLEAWDGVLPKVTSDAWLLLQGEF